MAKRAVQWLGKNSNEWLQPKGIENISSKWKPAWSEGANRTSQTGGMVITAFYYFLTALTAQIRSRNVH